MQVVFNGLAWFGPLPSAPRPAAAPTAGRTVAPVTVDQEVELMPALDAASAATDAAAREEIPPPAVVPPLIEAPPPEVTAPEVVAP